MYVYLINILILILYAAILLWIRPSQRNKKAFCALAAGNWILLSGLRHFSIGADTYAYRYTFYNSKYNSWEKLFENFKNTIFKWNIFEENLIEGAAETGDGLFEMILGENALAVKDPGYAILTKAFYSVIPNYTAYLVFIAIVFMVPLAILIYRYSREPLMSFLIYSCLFYSFFGITGHRQTLATGIALMGFLAFAEKKKFVPFLLTVLLAYPLHKSVAAFIPIYFLQHIKMDRKKVIAVLIAFPVVFLLRGPLATLLSNLSGYEGYNLREGGTPIMFLLVYIALMIVTLWKGKEALEVNPHANLVLAAVALAFLLTPLTFVNANLMRLVQYYSIFMILYIPDLIMAFDDHESQFAYLLALAVLIGLFVRIQPQYLFFWQ